MHGRVDFVVATGVARPELEPPRAVYDALVRRLGLLGGLTEQDEGYAPLDCCNAALDLFASGQGDARVLTVLVQRAGAELVPPGHAREIACSVLTTCALDGADHVRVTRGSARWLFVDCWAGGTRQQVRTLPAWMLEPIVRAELAALARVEVPSEGAVTGAIRLVHPTSRRELHFDVQLADGGVTFACYRDRRPAAPVPLLPMSRPIACRCGRPAPCACGARPPQLRRLAPPLVYDRRQRVRIALELVLVNAFGAAMTIATDDAVPVILLAVLTTFLLLALTAASLRYRRGKLPRATCRFRPRSTR